jgi:putative hydrolase of the HAD superfamily
VTPPVPFDSYDAVIFDLGGVILPLRPVDTIEAFSRLFETDASAAYTQHKQDPLFDDFERGEISGAAFRDHVKLSFGVSGPLNEEQFDAAWNAMLGILPDENLRLLQTLGQHKRLFLLSNTNEIHIGQFLRDYEARHLRDYGPWSAFFEHAHYSHDMGMRKPEPRIFQALIDRHRLTPSRTLFFDDHPSNISGAETCGLRALFHPTNTSLGARFELPAGGTT